MADTWDLDELRQVKELVKAQVSELRAKHKREMLELQQALANIERNIGYATTGKY